jgi:hypothetical protein
LDKKTREWETESVPKKRDWHWPHRKLPVDVRREYMDERTYSYMSLYIICGQKPEEGMSVGIEMAEMV